MEPRAEGRRSVMKRWPAERVERSFVIWRRCGRRTRVVRKGKPVKKLVLRS